MDNVKYAMSKEVYNHLKIGTSSVLKVTLKDSWLLGPFKAEVRYLSSEFKKKAKVNSQYYVNYILKPLLEDYLVSLLRCIKFF